MDRDVPFFALITLRLTGERGQEHLAPRAPYEAGLSHGKTRLPTPWRHCIDPSHTRICASPTPTWRWSHRYHPAQSLAPYRAGHQRSARQRPAFQGRWGPYPVKRP